MAKDPLIGQHLANYYIEYPLGRGGMAMVYYATDIKLDRPVAVKVINAQLQGNPSYAKRFVDEAKMVASWRHENIIHVYYADNEDDLYFFAMEYIEGASLEDLMDSYIEKGELMPHDDVIRIGRAVASALDYAHSKGVVHRDVKPSNIMIGRDDRIILADFGLALDTAQGTMGEVFGTPHYIAPEQALHSARAVPASDLYSLGVALYQMLTGFVPFDDETVTSIALQHMSEPPPNPRSWNPDLNQATEAVLLRMLSKEPENRYQSGQSMMDALEEAVKHRAVTETAIVDGGLPPPPPPVRMGKEPTQHSLSMVSISERVAMELSGRELPQPTPPSQRLSQPTAIPAIRQTPSPESTVASPKSKVDTTVSSGGSSESSNRGMLFGGIAVVAIVTIVAIIFMMNNRSDNGIEVVDNPTETTVAQSAVDSATELPPTNIPTIAPTDEPNIQPSEPPTSEPVIEPTIVPTDEPVVESTQSATPEPTATVEIPATAVAFPNGNLLQFTYDRSIFFIRNVGTENVRVSRLTFQAVDGNGNLMMYRYEGNNWAQSYSFVERNGNCVGLEITDRSPWNRPGDCGRINSLITPSPTDDRIFWAEQAVDNGAVAFAVFWDEVEIARCPINIGACDVRVGS